MIQSLGFFTFPWNEHFFISTRHSLTGKGNLCPGLTDFTVSHLNVTPIGSLLWPHQQPSEQAHLPPETVSSSGAQILDLSYILSAKGFWHNVALHYVFVNLNMSVMTEQLYGEK